MSWDTIAADGAFAGESLLQQIDALFAQQRATWPALRDGEVALSTMETKTLTDGGASVCVQANPRRKLSTHAKTDAASIAKRPCFLCPENMPPEERGIPFGELVILPNPFPVAHRHCTIPDRTHCPQRLAGRVGTMLELAHELGSEMMVFYNGPQCGASAPDHFHLQACDASAVPLLGELPKPDGSPMQTHASFGRHMLLFSGDHLETVQQNVEHTIDVLGRTSSDGEEPLFSLLAIHRNEQFTGVLFPRAIHRPACFFAKGKDQIAISPATLEMSGVVIVSDPEHLSRVDAATLRQIYEEVCIRPTVFSELAKEVLL